MTKSLVKPSDRGRNTPEPGPTPGTRAEQRDTDEQLAAAPEAGDDATAFERDEQENLPPRGEGSQHNQGMDRSPRLRETAPRVESTVDEEAGTVRAPAGTPAAEFHSGGTRGPSRNIG
jgi:hypothetical protein